MNEAPSKTKISSKIVYQNPWITIHEDQTISQDGNTGIYGYMESRDSCMIVVVDDQERLYLVRGFRYPSQIFGWELPGGGGDNEETSIIAQSWQKLGEAYVCNGLMTEKMAVFLARELSFTGQREQSDEVFSDMRFFTLNEIDDLIRNGEINDCQTLAGLHYYQLWRKDNL